MIELPDVGGPGMLEHRLERARREAGQRLAVLLGVDSQEMVGQARDVLGPVPQRGNMDLDRVQPEQKVLAETAGGGPRPPGPSGSPAKPPRPPPPPARTEPL